MFIVGVCVGFFLCAALLGGFAVVGAGQYKKTFRDE